MKSRLLIAPKICADLPINTPVVCRRPKVHQENVETLEKLKEHGQQEKCQATNQMRHGNPAMALESCAWTTEPSKQPGFNQWILWKHAPFKANVSNQWYLEELQSVEDAFAKCTKGIANLNYISSVCAKIVKINHINATVVAFVWRASTWVYHLVSTNNSDQCWCIINMNVIS